MQTQRTLQGGYVAMMSNKDEEHIIPMLENVADDVKVTLEPQTLKTKDDSEVDTLSSVSDAPSVEHFNISVSIIDQ